MNSVNYEVYNAIKDAQKGPETIRYVCLFCKNFLSGWDVREGRAVCSTCSSIYFPLPKIEAKKSGLQKATLFQLDDGRFAIIVE